jgi:hypothetical protein
MNIPTWTVSAVAGAVLGAAAAVAIGFTQGGWYTADGAEQLASEKSAVAAIDALVPVCLGQAKLDPDAAAKLKKMLTMVTSYEQRDYVMQVGWATLPATTGPNRDLASACADVLAKSRQG